MSLAAFAVLRADDDRKPVGFALAFQAGREIDAVAQHRIVEAQVGAHVADDASAGVDADADVDRDEQRAVGLGRRLALAVEPFDAFEHVEGGFAGVELVGRVVERRVPERHDRVAHVFVDGALAIDDGVGERREEAVHQRGQALRIVLVDLRDRGEAADVAEHDRHVARLAAEHELLRRLRKLLDQRRRKILTERRADLAPLRLLLDEIGEHQRQIDQQAGQQRKGEIDQQLLFREQVPGRADQQRDEGGAEQQQQDRAQDRRQPDDGDAHHERRAQFHADGIVRLRQHRVAQDAFQHLGVDFDARHGGIVGRGLQIEQAGRRGADEDKPAARRGRR